LERIFKVAVLGSAVIERDSPERRKARRIGELVAGRGHVLLTGGCTGLPHAAVAGAKSAGGITVAISPARDRAEHRDIYHYPLDSGVVLFTGMGTKGRNVILVRSSDACVFLGGGIGTLNEFTIAFDDLSESCAIGVLLHSGGLSDEISRLVETVGKAPRARLLMEPHPDVLMSEIHAHLADF
jgi:uncharacterized protein (TIGR00725 family)